MYISKWLGSKLVHICNFNNDRNDETNQDDHTRKDDSTPMTRSSNAHVAEDHEDSHSIPSIMSPTVTTPPVLTVESTIKAPLQGKKRYPEE